MKFSATVVSIALLLAGSAEAHAHIRNHRRSGPSATFGNPPTTPTATSPANEAPAAPTGSSSGQKRGLSFNDVGLTKNFNSNQVSWAYNWDSSFSGSLPDGVSFFPMLWSADGSHTSSWNDHATAGIAAGATHLFGFNEPDLSSQANMSPDAAAAAWKTYMEPFNGKATLVSPAITNGAPPAMGTGWLDSFLAACTGCHVGAIAIHIYDSATNIGYYQNYITGIVQKYGKPVMITEFGATGSAQQQQQFLSQMVTFLNDLDGVSHFAYFGDFVGVLVNSDASLSPLGQAYVS